MDVLSSLPGCIIDSILARLPLQEAVRTSTLSTEWRYQWTSIPDLVFDFQVQEILSPDPKHIDAIYQVLRHHRGPINKFYLRWKTSPHIDKWIRLLSSSQVHDLNLCILECSEDKHELASPFFEFQNLKHLYLSGCIFNPPPDFKGFSKLVTLEFEKVKFVPAIFQHFISQSPLLETMSITNCTGFDAFEVNGPSLRVFNFFGVISESICFKNSPFLVDVSISLYIWSANGFKCCQFPPMLEKLHLDPCILECSSACGLNSLKVVNLSMWMGSIKDVACVFCLAQSCPNLQMLTLTLHAYRNVESVAEFIRDQKRRDPCLHQLKRVEIKLSSCFESEMELLRYLLDSALELQEMVITTPYDYPLSHDVMNQLNQFPRASPTALVLVNERVCSC